MVPVHVYILWRYGWSYVGYARKRLGVGTLGGLASMGSYGIALWAMTLAPIAVVAALRETSVIFGMLLAMWLLHERFTPSRDMGAIAQKRGINVIAFGAIEEVELEENAYDIIYLNGSSSYMEDLTRAFDVCKKALKPNGKFISLDVPKESAFGFMYLLAKAVGTFDHPSLRGVMPKLPYPLELCCAGVWHSTEEKVDALKSLGFHDFDFYQTLLKNPMYTNESVEDVVPGYQSGGYVALIAHK